MFWGCISYYGVCTLTPVVGNLNSEKYINILDDNLWAVIAQHFPTSPYIFQEDNAPCHVSRRTNQWKTENDIPTLEWPPLKYNRKCVASYKNKSSDNTMAKRKRTNYDLSVVLLRF
jgi:hypothetical protein